MPNAFIRSIKADRLKTKIQRTFTVKGIIANIGKSNNDSIIPSAMFLIN